MEPVDLSAIPKSRWKLICYLCKKKMGACIQCDNRSCFAAFHVTCARSAGLFIKMRPKRKDYSGLNAIDQVENGDEDEDEKHILRAFCEKHLPKDFLKGGSDDSDAPSPPPKKVQKTKTAQDVIANAKSAKAYSKVYKAGPPVVPYAIVKNVVNYISRLRIQRKNYTVEAACRYWSLKREARRGAPLLKRLHLEPWTASNTAYRQSQADKKKKYGILRQIRNDLERVRMLSELTRKREREKYRQNKAIAEAIELALFPIEAHYKPVFDQVRALDKMGYFQEPVSRRAAPDYYEVISNPMDFSTMEGALKDHRYTIDSTDQEPKSARTPADDLLAITTNAMIYNKPDTALYRTASRLKKTLEPLLESSQKEFETRSLAHPQTLFDPETITDLFKIDYPMKPRSPSPPPLPKIKKEPKARVPTILGLRLDLEVAQSLDQGILLTEGRRTRSVPTTAVKPSPVQAKKAPGVQITPSRSSSRHASGIHAAQGTKSSNVPADTVGVSDRESFKNFNSGWILPPDQKRMRSGSLSPSVEPPDLKRIKKDSVPPGDATGLEAGPGSGLDAELTTPSSKTIGPRQAPTSTPSKAGPKKGALVPPSAEELEQALPTTEKDSDALENLNGGTLVWAKVPSYPFFPAEVFVVGGEDDDDIPPSVLASRPANDREGEKKGDHVLVQFFEPGNSRSWAWIPRLSTRMKMCHEDRRTDQVMLNIDNAQKATSVGTGGQQTLSSHMRTSVRLAYLKALSDLEVE